MTHYSFTTQHGPCDVEADSLADAITLAEQQTGSKVWMGASVNREQTR